MLAPGQQQKELYHNEAVQQIELLLCPVVEGAATVAPPTNPAMGNCYLVASGATGEWAGHDDALAGFTDGGWRFVTPIEGMNLFDRATGQMVLRRNGSWETGIARCQEVRINGDTVLRNRQSAIASPAGGSVADAECRSAVSSILAALRAHGLIA